MNRLSGPLPQTMFRTTLQSLLLQQNNLSGWVLPMGSQPPSYGEGSIADLSHNSITGELSPILAGVESLFLNNNRLIGREMLSSTTLVNSFNLLLNSKASVELFTTNPSSSVTTSLENSGGRNLGGG
ncbi:unnamed protein product [Prunus armeniaca]|uniref:Leucine-rich repeat-containing N-terminal plant-type domain-containing protein n=1 Tax=Prunus armeniaca TaxID=36596 RepID=A0A6J5TSJ3_PRUAR|nr:unnamed protein product [Prunus armeniaca]